MRNPIRYSLISLSLFFSAASATAEAADPSFPDDPALIARDAELVRKAGTTAIPTFTLVDRFSGPVGSHLTGVRLRDEQGRSAIGWITSDGRHLLVGALFDGEGRNLSQVAGAHAVRHGERKRGRIVSAPA